MAVPTPRAKSRLMTEEDDHLQIKSIDHVHFWVGNARQAMYYWWKGLGFKPVAYSGLETGNRRFASYVLESGQDPPGRLCRIRAERRDRRSPPAARRRREGHCAGGGRRRASLRSDHAARCSPAWEPRAETDEHGVLRSAAIHTYGEVLHVFVDRSEYAGPFAPTYRSLDMPRRASGLGCD